MLKAFASRQTGCLTPLTLLQAESTRRAYCLELSRFFDVDKVHTGAINSLDIDLAESRYLLSGTADCAIAIHDLHNISGEPKSTYPSVCHIGRQHKDAHKFSVETVQWYPLDTGMFTSSGSDKLLKVWDANHLKVADEYEFSGLVYSHDMSSVATQHSLLAVGAKTCKVHLLDLKSGSATHTLRGHRHPVVSVAWSTKDEFLLATGGEDSKLHLWDVRTAKGPLMVLDQHNGQVRAAANSVNTAHDGFVNGVCFTSDGLRLISCGTDNQMRVWSTSTGLNMLINFGKVYNDCQKNIQLAVSKDTNPDLVFVPSNSNIDIFNISNADKIGTLRGHYNQVNTVIFDGQEQTLYSGGNDRNILIWTPETESVLGYIDHLAEGRQTAARGVYNRVGMADAWSDDED